MNPANMRWCHVLFVEVVAAIYYFLEDVVMPIVRAVEKWRAKRRRRVCEHEWVEPRFGVRDCKLCGAHEMLYHRRFPSETKPSLEWK